MCCNILWNTSFHESFGKELVLFIDLLGDLLALLCEGECAIVLFYQAFLFRQFFDLSLIHILYYQIGEEHKEFCAEKTQDEDYYVLTLVAIARELDGKGMNQAKVHIAAGLPLTWVATQKEDFQKYLLQNESVDFIFRNKEYHVEFAGADIYPQGFAAAFYRLQDFKGINMLVDIGNGTMNIMYINNSRPLEKKCFTEKYGTHQCVLRSGKTSQAKGKGRERKTEKRSRSELDSTQDRFVDERNLFRRRYEVTFSSLLINIHNS